MALKGLVLQEEDDRQQDSRYELISDTERFWDAGDGFYVVTTCAT